jgi:hypothetical protein
MRFVIYVVENGYILSQIMPVQKGEQVVEMAQDKVFYTKEELTQEIYTQLGGKLTAPKPVEKPKSLNPFKRKEPAPVEEDTKEYSE